MISDEDVEKLLDWMVKHAAAAAEASGHVVIMEEGLKTAIAMAASKSMQPSAAAAEREARLTNEVQVAIAGKAAAVEKDCYYKILYKTGGMKFEAWRTMSANARAEGKIG